MHVVRVLTIFSPLFNFVLNDYEESSVKLSEDFSQGCLIFLREFMIRWNVDILHRYDYFLLLLGKSSIWFTKKHFFKILF